MLMDNTDCYKTDPFWINDGVVDFLKFFRDHADDPEKVYDMYQERYSREEFSEE